MKEKWKLQRNRVETISELNLNLEYISSILAIYLFGLRFVQFEWGFVRAKRFVIQFSAILTDPARPGFLE